MSFFDKTRVALCASLLCSALAACGGDGDETPVTPPPPSSEDGSAQKDPAAKVTVPEGLKKLAPPPLETDPKALNSERGRASQRVASVGTAAAVIAEPDVTIKRQSPKALIQDTVQMALSGDNIAALARLSRSKSSHPKLTEDDAADARRRFLSPSMKVYWQKINAAVRAGSYKVVENGDQAQVLVDVGGAAGTYRVRLVKEGDAWYLAD